MRHLALKGQPRRRGSLLVPLLAAILILSLAGIVLSQSFSAQRVQSVLAVQSARAFWSAEAGSWHASMQQARLDQPVTFDLGTYVTELEPGTTDQYVSAGHFGDASRRVPLLGELAKDLNNGEAEVFTVPIDQAATNASAHRDNRFRFEVLLHSARDYPSVLSSMTFGSSDQVQNVSWVASFGTRVWTSSGFVANRPITLDLSDADLSLRIVEPDTPLSLLFRLRPEPQGTDTIDLGLTFSDGSTSQLQFPITW